MMSADTRAAPRLAEGLCAVAVTLYAAAAAAHEIVLAAGASLAVLSWLTVALWAGFAIAAIVLWRRAGPPQAAGASPPRAGRAEAGGLALLLLAGAALAVIAFRPDFDDSYYLANVTFAAADPQAPITDAVRGMAAAPLETFRSSHWATAVAYDYLSASLGHLTGLHHLDIAYLILPGLAGAVLVAGCFLLLLRVCPDQREALVATVAVVALFVIWREAHRDPGNFAFVRFFQGKAVVMTALMPVFAAWLWGFLRQPTALLAGGIAALALGAGGMTASAVPLFGGIGVGVTAAALAERPGQALRIAGRAAVAAALCLPFVPALWGVLADPLPLGPDSPANEGWPTTVAGHAAFLGKSTWALLAASLVLVAWRGRGAARRAILAWTAVVGVVFLNPVTGQVWLDTVLGPNAFWRLFYILPWVPLAGLSALLLVDLLPRPLARWRTGVFAAALVLAVPGMAALDGLRGQPVPHWPPGWKLDRETRAQAEAVIAASPAGPMLAPLKISRQIPILSANHPQLRQRTFGLRVWALHAGAPDLADRRILATAALSGAERPGAETRNANYLDALGPTDLEAQLDALSAVLSESAPVSVVLRRDAPSATDVSGRLRAAGYTRHAETALHEIWTPGRQGWLRMPPAGRDAIWPVPRKGLSWSNGGTALSGIEDAATGFAG